MITVIVGPHKFTGVIRNYEFEGDDLVLNFELRDPDYIKLILPKIPPDLRGAMTSIGSDVIRDSVIDLNKGEILLPRSNTKFTLGGNQE